MKQLKVIYIKWLLIKSLIYIKIARRIQDKAVYNKNYAEYLIKKLDTLP